MADRVRPADPSEITEIADLWYAGWQEAHAEIVPAELSRLRSHDDFVARTQDYLGAMRVSGAIGRPGGMCLTKDDELNQLYVSSEARGTGLAKALLQDAECLLRARGVSRAWLACAIGNRRAARFYEKCGWQMARTETVLLDTSERTYPLEIWRFEKDLASA